MLLRVTNEFGSGFTIFANRAAVQQVIADYAFMGYKAVIL